MDGRYRSKDADSSNPFNNSVFAFLLFCLPSTAHVMNDDPAAVTICLGVPVYNDPMTSITTKADAVNRDVHISNHSHPPRASYS